MQSEWALDELDFAKHEKERIVLVSIDNAEMTGNFYFRYHKYDTITDLEKKYRNKRFLVTFLMDISHFFDINALNSSFFIIFVPNL